MGANGSSSSNSSQLSQEYLQDQVDLIQKMDNEAYSSFQLMKDKKTNKEFVLIDRVYRDEDLHKQLEQESEQKKKFHSPYVAKVLAVLNENKQELCGRFFRILVSVEYISLSLRELIDSRIQTGASCSEREILRMIESVISALKFLRETQNSEHGRISPCSILVDTSSQSLGFKLTDAMFFHQNQTFYSDFFNGKLNYLDGEKNKNHCYLSPNLLDSLHQNLINPIHDPEKSNIFSLGLCALEMVTMQTIDEVLNLEGQHFIVSQENFEDILENKVGLSISNTLKELLERMLKVSENERIDYNQILEFCQQNQSLMSSRYQQQTRSRCRSSVGGGQNTIDYEYNKGKKAYSTSKDIQNSRVQVNENGSTLTKEFNNLITPGIQILNPINKQEQVQITNQNNFIRPPQATISGMIQPNHNILISTNNVMNNPQFRQMSSRKLNSSLNCNVNILKELSSSSQKKPQSQQESVVIPTKNPVFSQIHLLSTGKEKPLRQRSQTHLDSMSLQQSDNSKYPQSSSFVQVPQQQLVHQQFPNPIIQSAPQFNNLISATTPVQQNIIKQTNIPQFKLEIVDQQNFQLQQTDPPQFQYQNQRSYAYKQKYKPHNSTRFSTDLLPVSLSQKNQILQQQIITQNLQIPKQDFPQYSTSKPQNYPQFESLQKTNEIEIIPKQTSPLKASPPRNAYFKGTTQREQENIPKIQQITQKERRISPPRSAYNKQITQPSDSRRDNFYYVSQSQDNQFSSGNISLIKQTSKENTLSHIQRNNCLSSSRGGKELDKSLLSSYQIQDITCRNPSKERNKTTNGTQNNKNSSNSINSQENSRKLVETLEKLQTKIEQIDQRLAKSPMKKVPLRSASASSSQSNHLSQRPTSWDFDEEQINLTSHQFHKNIASQHAGTAGKMKITPFPQEQYLKNQYGQQS